MKFTTIASTLALAATVIASPRIPHRSSGVSQAEAESVVSKIISIFGHQPGANATAHALLADNFVEHSDSILALEGQPVSPPS